MAEGWRIGSERCLGSIPSVSRQPDLVCTKWKAVHVQQIEQSDVGLGRGSALSRRVYGEGGDPRLTCKKCLARSGLGRRPVGLGEWLMVGSYAPLSKSSRWLSREHTVGGMTAVLEIGGVLGRRFPTYRLEWMVPISEVTLLTRPTRR